MGNVAVEVGLISARGLRKTASSLLRLQWFAVMWIDPNNKYSTKLTASGNSNPVWNTKFSAMVDEAKDSLQLLLHVQVYSREPLFLRERVEGEACVGLKEFLDNYVKNSARGCPGAEELGSFQLRKPKSDKARGFIDMSVKISEEINAASSLLGKGEGFQLRNQGRNTSLAGEGLRDQPGSSQSAHLTAGVPSGYHIVGTPQPPSNFSYNLLNHHKRH